MLISALLNFIDWLDSTDVVDLPETRRGELVLEFLAAHQEGENYFLQAEQIATILSKPFVTSKDSNQ